MRRAFVLTMLAAAALAVSACGGGGDKELSKAEFESQIGKILRPLQGRTLQELVTISAGDPQAARKLKRGEEKLRDAASELTSMKPPADAVDPTQSLADGVDKIADQVTAAREDAERGNFGKLIEFKVRLATDPAVAQIRDAALQLINLGYNIAGDAP